MLIRNKKLLKREYDKRRYLQKRKEILDYYKQYYSKHSEKIKKYGRNYYYKNKKRLLFEKQIYYIKNKEKFYKRIAKIPNFIKNIRMFSWRYYKNHTKICMNCKNTEDNSKIEIHHINYTKNPKDWLLLCSLCHGKIHRRVI